MIRNSWRKHISLQQNLWNAHFTIGPDFFFFCMLICTGCPQERPPQLTLRRRRSCCIRISRSIPRLAQGTISWHSSRTCWTKSPRSQMKCTICGVNTTTSILSAHPFMALHNMLRRTADLDRELQVWRRYINFSLSPWFPAFRFWRHCVCLHLESHRTPHVPAQDIDTSKTLYAKAYHPGSVETMSLIWKAMNFVDGSFGAWGLMTEQHRVLYSMLHHTFAI